MERLGQPSVFNCSRCGQPYSSRYTLHKGGRVPLVLNCGHSCCDSCVTKVIKKPGDSLTCIICNTVSKSSDNYNSSKPELEFAQNSFILGKLMQKSHSGWDDNKISFTINAKALKSPRSIECHECAERRAEVNCVQCQVPYCDVCFHRVHQVAKALKGHEATDLSELKMETKCSIHNCSLQFWCEPCLKTLCSSCLTSAHNGHTVSLLVDKNTSCWNDFLDCFTKVSTVRARLEATRKKATGNLSKLEGTKHKEVELEIKEHFSRLHGLLIERENSLLRRLYSPTVGSANSLKTILQQIDRSVQELERDLETSASLIEYSGKYLNCCSYMDMLERLRAKENTPCFLVLSSDDKQSSKFVFEEDLFEKVKSHGQIDLSEDEPLYRLVTEQNLPSDFILDPVKISTIDSLVSPYNMHGKQSKCDSTSSLSPAISNISLTSTSQSDLPPPTRNPSSTDFYNKNFDDLVQGCKVKVILTHATSPNDFYVRRPGLDKKLMEINYTFSKLNLKIPCKERLRVGDHYMAQFSQDNRWYRSIATAVDDNLITVFYIDFGNQETVKRESLRLMPSSLMKYDGMALHCSLHDCEPLQEDKWDPQTITTMLKITDKSNGDLCMIICKRSDDMLYVDLLKNTNMDVVSLRKALIFLNLAQARDTATLEADKVNQRNLPLKKTFENGLVMNISISHCVSPCEFYIHDVKNIVVLKQLTSGLHEMYSKKSESSIIYHPKIGMIVACLSGIDNMWRRARISALPDYKKVEVVYLDFGNSEVVSYKRLRYLAHKFFKVGLQCSRCRLTDIKPSGEQETWSKEAIETFCDLIQHRCTVGPEHPETEKVKLSMIVQSVHEDTYDTLLYRDKENVSLCINAALVKQNLAISTGIGSSLLEIPSDINKHSVPQARRVAKGGGGVQSWKFQESSEALAQVRDLLMAQSKLPDVHQSLPALTQSPPRFSTDYLGMSSSSLLLPHKLSESAMVKPLASKSKKTCLSEDSVSHTTPTKGSEEELIKLPVHIVKVVSPSEFYVTPTSLLPKLKSLKSSMQKLYSCDDKRVQLEDVSEGTVCVIKRSPQNDWCRAVIIAVTDDHVKIHLPDFGEESEAKKVDLYTMAEKFRGLRDGVTRCHLGGLKQPLEDRWPMTSTDELVEFADKYDGKIYITKLGEERADSLSVEVLMKEEVTASALEPTKITWTSLNNNLRMRGLALGDGTIDWNVEDYKYVAYQSQSPHFKMDVFKGIPIQYKSVSQQCEAQVSEEMFRTNCFFGGMNVTVEEDDEVVGANSLSRLSLSDSCSFPTEKPVDSVDVAPDHSSSTMEKVTSGEVVPLMSEPMMCAPVMPKAWLPPLPFNKLEFLANPTNVDNNACVFLQDFQKSVATLKRIGEVLDSHCRMSLPTGHDLYWSVGQTCIARYHLDKKWYRGVVKSMKENNTMAVELVDYGNIEECSVMDLRKMPLTTDIPIQGRFCQLNKVKPKTGDGKWRIPVLDTIHSLVVEKHCLVNLSLDSFDNTYSIESMKLPDGSEMLALMVKEGLADYSEKSLPVGPCAVQISQTPLDQSPQPSTSPLLQIISEKNLTVEDKPVDISESAEDEESEVRTKSWVEQCEELLDSSEDQDTTDLANALSTKLVETFSTVPDIGQRVVTLTEGESESLAGDHIPSTSVEEYDESYESDSYLLYLEPPKDVELFEVEILDVFIGVGAAVVSFHITDSIDQLLNDSQERFHELSKILQEEAPLQPLVRRPRLNDVCCGKFSQDGLWYRALITDVPDDQNIVVKYIDYGNSEQLPLSMIRQMKKEWFMVEVQLFTAKLHNLEVLVPEDKWNCVKYLIQEVLLESKLTAVVIEHTPELMLELYKGTRLAYRNVIDSGFFKLVKT